LPAADLAAVKKHLAAGKPLVGIRTSSHAFDTRGKHPEGHAEWPRFDPEVLGGNYRGHHGGGPTTTVTLADGAAGHPIVASITRPFTSVASLYQVAPLEKGAKPLLIGRIPGKDPEPVAWTNRHGNASIFYTSLGHEKDFADGSFLALLENGIRWVLEEHARERRVVKKAE